MTRSRLRAADTFTESWIHVARRPGRALIASVGIALGAAAIVATLSLVETIRHQVADTFDARLATQLDVRPADIEGITVFPPEPEDLARLDGLSGVRHVTVTRQAQTDLPIAPNRLVDPLTAPQLTPVHLVDVAAFDALDLVLDGPGWDAWHERHQQRVVVLTRAIAESMGMPDARLGDQVVLDGLAYTVVGVLDRAPRLPTLTNGVLVPVTLADTFRTDPSRDRITVVVAAGAAPAVTDAAPVALSPTTPSAWTAYSPVADQTLRLAIDDQLRTLFLGLGAIVLLLGIVSIGNVTLSSVLQRVPEIGLRRAVGARPTHITAHVLLDAGITGALGGALGALLGLAATLTITAVQGWLPIIDLRLPTATVAIGFAAGVLAGLYPARVASRLQPTEALRRA